MRRAAWSLAPACLLLGALRPASGREVILARGQEDLRILGAGNPDELGSGAFSLSAGDLDHDGETDVVVGSSSSGAGSIGRPFSGTVHVFFGPLPFAAATLDLASAPADVTIHGAQGNASNGDRLGWGVAVGDLSGDGRDDLVAAAPYATGSASRAGRIYVFFGPLAAGSTIDLASAAADVVIDGDAEWDAAGTALAVGELSGDSWPDLAIGAWTASSLRDPADRAGEAWVLFGPFARGQRIALRDGGDFAVNGEGPSDYLGHGLAIGDVSGDGQPDLALGAFEARSAANAEPRTGAVYVVFGPLVRGRRLDLGVAAADVSIYGAEGSTPGWSPGDGIGRSLAVAELSGDAVPDLVVGADQADGPANVRPDTGEVHVLFGPLAPGVIDLAATPGDVVVHGEGAWENLGQRVAAGDLDGDCSDDLVAAAPDPTDLLHPTTRGGVVHVLAGPFARGTVHDLATAPADLTVRVIDRSLSSAPTGFGTALVVADLGGDGLPDLLASNPLADPLGRDGAGSVHAVAGAQNPLTGLPIVTGLRAVRRSGDADFVWDPAPAPAVSGYNLWRVESQDRTRIPVANLVESRRASDIVAACFDVPRATPACPDAGAVPRAPALVFYQVRSHCGERFEGTAHPY